MLVTITASRMRVGSLPVPRAKRDVVRRWHEPAQKVDSL